jgi:septin family protein
MPFCVIGSESEAKVGGKMVRCREYSWGLAEGLNGPLIIVENEDHCDFVKLRNLLIRYASNFLIIERICMI